MSDFEHTAVSNDVIESKYGYCFSGEFVRKHNSLKYNDLFAFVGGMEPKKRGAPRNEGMSNDVYENKGQKICLLRMSNDMYENTRLTCYLLRSA